MKVFDIVSLIPEEIQVYVRYPYALSAHSQALEDFDLEVDTIVVDNGSITLKTSAGKGILITNKAGLKFLIYDGSLFELRDGENENFYESYITSSLKLKTILKENQVLSKIKVVM